MNKEIIYTVTTIRYFAEAGRRAVGFFHEFDVAVDALVENYCDINEDNYYPYAVIEGVRPGFYMVPREEFWYKWDEDKQEYISCEKPDRFKNIVAWSLG